MPKIVNRFFHKLRRIWPLSLTLTKTLKKEEAVLTEEMKMHGFTPARSGKLSIIQNEIEARDAKRKAKKEFR